MRKRFTADYYGHERYHGYASLPENALPLTRRELFYLGGGVAIGALTSCALNLLLPNDDCSSEMQLTTQASNTSADNTTQDSAEPVTLESLPWNLQLVNKSHYLEDENAIGELKVLPDKSWTDVSRGLQVDSRILESLCSMMDAAQKEGVSPLVCSAYRTFEYQEGLYQRRVQKARDDGYTDAEAEASFWVAPPGASEHHTGLALDIVDASYTNLDEDQETTRAQKWLMANCDQFGFILRYPTNKSKATGIGYEPWHYRYVGEEAASTIKASGLCLEEWLAQEYGVVDI